MAVIFYEKAALYLFASDPTLPDYYTRLGWSVIGMDKFNGNRIMNQEF